MGWRKVVAVAGLALAVYAPAGFAGQPPTALPSTVTAHPVASPAHRPSRLRLAAQKFTAPQFQRSEAGIGWSLSERMTIQLDYERGAYGPLMHQDHDNGILTTLRLGFD
jgi:hypothetical protein